MKKKLLLNTITSLLLQVVVVVSGFILPRIRLTYLGSDVNGLIQSVTQFLSVISLMELGVGQVIQSSLYKPLAEHDVNKISTIITAGGKFFRRIAYMMFGYVFLLICIFPLLTKESFSWIYIATLIAAMCISSFAQYYFGIIDGILLSADQRGYIHYTSQMIAIILNTTVSGFLLVLGAPIQLVMLAGSLIHLMRPFAIRLYIRKRYPINRKMAYTEDPLPQKWHGMAQHFSAYVLNGTDTIVLTLFSSLGAVSIYSVYNMVTNGIHTLYRSATAGLHAMFGELWAKQDTARLNRVFGYMEAGLHFSTVFLFSCTGILILPFIRVYTNGITDVNYHQPLFAVLLVIAHALQCLRTIYNIPILAGGHYKKTQSCHIIAAGLNLAISIVTVFFWGLVGIAIGTIIAIGFQVVWMAIYDSKSLIRWPILKFIKQMCVDAVTVLLIVGATWWIKLKELTYLSWLIMALQVVGIALAITLLMALIFYGKFVAALFRRFIKKHS